MTIVKKATGATVDRNIPENNLSLYLACLPAGVYSVEDSDGIEIAIAAVSRGRVKITEVRDGNG